MTKSTSTPEKPTRESFGDTYDSLTWHDEQAIDALGVSIHDLMQDFGEGKAGVRAMVHIVRAFEVVHERRAGKGTDAAVAAVRGLTNAQLTELLDAYLDHEDEPMPEEPVTAEGKGD